MLLVTPALDAEGGIVIVDPLRGNEIAFRSDSYADVADFLVEDEYQLFTGRMAETDPMVIAALDFEHRRRINQAALNINEKAATEAEARLAAPWSRWRFWK
jgi:hypothetical protein